MKVVLLIIALFALVKIWPSDRFPLLALAAYVPSTLLFVTAIASAVSFFGKREVDQKPWQWLALVMIAMTFVMICVENRPLFEPAPDLDIRQNRVRIFHWNIWGSRSGIENISDAISQQTPDVICLNEPKTFFAAPSYPPYETKLTGHWHKATGLNMLILSRIAFSKVQTFEFRGLRALEVTLETQPSRTILFLDVRANMGFFRLKAFQPLSGFLEHTQSPPDVILGDLNTPARSFSIRTTFGAQYHDAYLLSGTGIGYTWPSFFPLMRLDQLVVKNGTPLLGYRHGASKLSDHCWQWAEIGVENAKQ